MAHTMIGETPAVIGEQVTLKGWVDAKRDHGNVTFIDLRDRSGIVQCVAVKKMQEVTQESVVAIHGLVKERPEHMINDDLVTGGVEVEVEEYEILNAAEALPLPIDEDGYDINEEVRLRERQVDLRRSRLRKNLQQRSEYIRAFREALAKRDFTEVETPMLTKSTKEGARDFIVPSRLQPGSFYALPQSPQQYKQLLMTAGVERYFQFAKCIRDEDLRADRGFEHTQIDIEMSFVNRDEVMQTVEDMVKEATTAVDAELQNQDFPVYTYEQAMKEFGEDKFDLRTDEEKERGVLAFAWVVDFPFFQRTDQADQGEQESTKSDWVFTHNPFSMPKEESMADHMAGENIGDILTSQYDLVCNGYEVGGGSIRAHDPAVLEQTFKIMGYSDEEIEASIGHMLRAFRMGTPPHGGIALGLDRHAMILANEKSLKEVIAFPMNSSGRTAVMDAPQPVSQEQLDELQLTVEDQE